MLEQVREAPLAVALHQRADIHAHADRYLARRHAILAHGIAYTVGKPPEFPRVVMDEIALLIEPGILGGLDRTPHRLRIGYVRGIGRNLGLGRQDRRERGESEERERRTQEEMHRPSI
ncbi:hypothetical protein [Sphingomonas leidyi]|uniref:hypothetical protein n=1 Tax=Sphingomonas leidyi TaxID=68569 RepID=UPI0036D40236